MVEYIQREEHNREISSVWKGVTEVKADVQNIKVEVIDLKLLGQKVSEATTRLNDSLVSHLDASAKCKLSLGSEIEEVKRKQYEKDVEERYKRRVWKERAVMIGTTSAFLLVLERLRVLEKLFAAFSG
jgi:hypothetical protein